jgi:hypothetical protein
MRSILVHTILSKFWTIQKLFKLCVTVEPFFDFIASEKAYYDPKYRMRRFRVILNSLSQHPTKMDRQSVFKYVNQKYELPENNF